MPSDQIQVRQPYTVSTYWCSLINKVSIVVCRCGKDVKMNGRCLRVGLKMPRRHNRNKWEALLRSGCTVKFNSLCRS